LKRRAPKEPESSGVRDMLLAWSTARRAQLT